MTYRLLLVFFLLSFFSISAQTTNSTSELKEIAFSELISELTNGKDSIFSLKNAIVKFDKAKSERYSLIEYRFGDKKYPTDTIHIHKTINFDNVHFDKNQTVYNYAFINFHFYKSISINNTSDIIFFNCQFDSSISRSSDVTYSNNNNLFWVEDCTFNSKVDINDLGDNEQLSLYIYNNTFNALGPDNYSEAFAKPLLRIAISGATLAFSENIINYNNATFNISTLNTTEVYFQKNKIQSKFWNYLYLDNADKLSFDNNTIESDLLFGIDKLKTEYEMQWPISENKIIPANYIIYNQGNIGNIINKTFDSLYINSRVTEESYYKNELTLLSKFHSYFTDFHDRQSANDVYIKIKHLETERLEHLYKEDKSFTNYFEMIVNRFLERFSDYGTSPSKIVIYSFKIILLFAFLFLFSTNSWNKINLNRYNKGITQSIN